jgi:hypothetical protein
MVATAPLESEYGSGQSRNMISSFRPSCLRVRARAAKRVSLARRRETKERRRERETMKEAVEPQTVAVAAINQLWTC